jgi:hypothetical protein
MPPFHQHVGGHQAGPAGGPIEDGAIVAWPDQYALRGGRLAAKPGDIVEFVHEISGVPTFNPHIPNNSQNPKSKI